MFFFILLIQRNCGASVIVLHFFPLGFTLRKPRTPLHEKICLATTNHLLIPERKLLLLALKGFIRKSSECVSEEFRLPKHRGFIATAVTNHYDSRLRQVGSAPRTLHVYATKFIARLKSLQFFSVSFTPFLQELQSSFHLQFVTTTNRPLPRNMLMPLQTAFTGIKNSL
jgi:hypothetical protein